MSDEVCRWCSGSGISAYADAENPQVVLTRPCERCRGTGKVEGATFLHKCLADFVDPAAEPAPPPVFITVTKPAQKGDGDGSRA